MSRSPITHGWRYYGCARWGCDAVNPDYQSYGAAGRSWCLHHRPGPIRRFLMQWTVFPAPPTRNGTPEGMLPVDIVHRHYELRPDTAHYSADSVPISRTAERKG